MSKMRPGVKRYLFIASFVLRFWGILLRMAYAVQNRDKAQYMKQVELLRDELVVWYEETVDD